MPALYSFTFYNLRSTSVHRNISSVRVPMSLAMVLHETLATTHNLCPCNKDSIIQWWQIYLMHTFLQSGFI